MTIGSSATITRIHGGSNGTIQVNGKTFPLPSHPQNISIINGKIMIDDVEFKGTSQDSLPASSSSTSTDSMIVHITIHGDVGSVSNVYGKNSITGNVHNVSNVHGRNDIQGTASNVCNVSGRNQKESSCISTQTTSSNSPLSHSISKKRKTVIIESTDEEGESSSPSSSNSERSSSSSSSSNETEGKPGHPRSTRNKTKSIQAKKQKIQSTSSSSGLIQTLDHVNNQGSILQMNSVRVNP